MITIKAYRSNKKDGYKISSVNIEVGNPKEKERIRKEFYKIKGGFIIKGDKVGDKPAEKIEEIIARILEVDVKLIKLKKFFDLNEFLAKSYSSIANGFYALVDRLNVKFALGIAFLFMPLWVHFFGELKNEDGIENIVINLVLGTICFLMGMGLLLMSYSEKRKIKETDSSTPYIGKQLFEKGLYALVIGVILGLFNSLSK